MNQQERDNLVGRLQSEAEYAARAWDYAWNGGLERTDDREAQREYLHAAALALNALGSIRLAQAIHSQTTSQQP